MLFNSVTFLIFAGVFFALWPFLKRTNNGRWLYLVVASFFFYGWWDWRFLFLIIGSGLIDFYAGLALDKWPTRRKLFLILSLLGNIGSLAAFKYSGFFAENLAHMASWFGWELELKTRIPDMMLIVPVGISFYTFQSMSYTIDIYRGHLKPTRNILHFFAYLSLFPQLVAGPIVRASDLLPQLVDAPDVNADDRFNSLKLIIRGFFKKVVVADTLAVHVNTAFAADVLETSAVFWWIIMIMFALQIYCDFSGYSDIAIGLGKWMGYDFPTNFNHPYIATSIKDFWSRWHISLSTWFRDYVYIPLGGARCSKPRAHMNAWIAMTVSGLWHGAAWPFVIWGMLQAFYLSLERITRWPEHLQKIPGGRHVSMVVVWFLTLIGWTFFRAGTVTPKAGVTRLGRAMEIIGNMFSFSDLNVEVGTDLLKDNVGWVIGVMLIRQLYFHFKLDQRPKALNPPQWYRKFQVVVYALLMMCCVYFRGTAETFIYFQF